MLTRISIALLAVLFVSAAGADAPGAAAPGAAAPTRDPEAGLQAVVRLGEANGLALACGAKEAAARAKQLMLLHAPRSSRFGVAFEQSTQSGYLGQVKGSAPCPSAAEISVRIESIALVLRETLPADE